MNTEFTDIVKETAGDIDWHRMARQKAAAVELASNLAIDPHYREMMTGLVNFLDNFQDTSAELGLPVVFLHEGGFKDKDGNPVPEPTLEEHPFVVAARRLLDSGDNEGCDGLVVVGEKEYAGLREALHQTTGTYAGFEANSD